MIQAFVQVCYEAGKRSNCGVGETCAEVDWHASGIRHGVCREADETRRKGELGEICTLWRPGTGMATPSATRNYRPIMPTTAVVRLNSAALWTESTARGRSGLCPRFAKMS